MELCGSAARMRSSQVPSPPKSLFESLGLVALISFRRSSARLGGSRLLVRDREGRFRLALKTSFGFSGAPLLRLLPGLACEQPWRAQRVVDGAAEDEDAVDVGQPSQLTSATTRSGRLACSSGCCEQALPAPVNTSAAAQHYEALLDIFSPCMQREPRSLRLVARKEQKTAEHVNPQPSNQQSPRLHGQRTCWQPQGRAENRGLQC